ncbi:MAG: hypothetical protein FWC76_04450 [Defluviitaleaceae bacterium]|nr:hypothetical protein [Defluviitaleaceae bacterium]
MKKFMAILLAIPLLTMSSCSVHFPPRDRDIVRIFDADYIARYADTLNTMFDYDWLVISEEERFEIPERMDIGPAQFIEWTIEYQDGNGDTRHFVLNNELGFAWQVERYVERYIGAYFRQNFLDVYMEDFPLAPSTNVFAFIARAGLNLHLPENQEWKRATDEYKRQLATPDGAIRLAQLTPANVFEMAPIRLSIWITLGDDVDMYNQDVAGYAIRQIESMMESINSFTGNRLNAQINMNHEHNQHEWNYIQGEQVFDLTWGYFDRYVFESYKGVFW